MLYFTSNKINLSNKINKLLILFFTCSLSVSYAIDVPIYDFSIKPYPQNVSEHLSPASRDYSKPLVKPDYQFFQLQQFYRHYYASDDQGLSPWSRQMVNVVLPVVKKIEMEIVDDFDNRNKADPQRHYAENFKEHDEIWLDKIKQNMNLYSLNTYQEKNRAIAIVNTYARALPDIAPDFFHFSLPGQGFPFDNLQESVVWSGTPLYVFGTSQDKAWSLVLTPDAYFAWVKSNDIAYASPEFITQWQSAAQKGLVAITKTDTYIVDKHQHFQFKGYIGAVFPLAQRSRETTSILIPLRNKAHQAVISTGVIDKKSASLMPLRASKKNIAKIIKQLQNRPYGWGGAFFFNDCSQEMKSIFTPFGIWLPRNSSQQSQLSTLDLSQKSVDERINILKATGHPLMTLIYIGGHVMLYVGNEQGSNHELEVMTYQNVWGLSPKTRDKRYVIGQSLFLPLLKYYPENPEINSLANTPYFKLVYLDELNKKTLLPSTFAQQFMKIDFATAL